MGALRQAVATDTRSTERALDWQSLDLAGQNLIEASAGTGKTFTLVLLVLRLLLERELPVSAILLSTFTEAAAAELRGRVASRIAQAYRAALPIRDPEYRSIDASDPLQDYLQRRWHVSTLTKSKSSKYSVRERDLQLLKAAMFQVGEMAIKTLHGFCQFVLSGLEGPQALRNNQRLIDASWLNEQAIDDAIRRRFVDVQALNALQADCLDTTFLRELRAALGRVLKYGRLTMRPAEVPNIEVYAARRSALFEPSFIEALQLDLANSELQLRAQARSAVRMLIGAFKLSPVHALPHGALKLLTRSERDLVILRQRKPLASFTSFARLREFAAYAKTQRRAQFGQWVVQLNSELRQQRMLHLQARRASTFDSMIEDLAVLLDPPEPAHAPAARELAASIRARFPAALIDEFQDTDEQQWAILRAIYGTHGGLILVGDPKQAIYRFRGSDIHTFIRAKQHCTCFYLNQNFRARPELLTALKHFYQCVDDPFFSPDVRFRAPTAGRSASENLPVALQFIECTSQSSVVVACLHLAQRYHAATAAGKGPSMAMLLARRNDVRLAQQSLLDLGVHARSGVVEEIVESPLALRLRVILAALLKANDVAGIRSAWLQLGHQPWYALASAEPAELLQWAASRQQRWRQDGVGALILDLAKEMAPESPHLAAAEPGVRLRWESDAKQLAEYLADLWFDLRPARAELGSLEAFNRAAQKLLSFLAAKPAGDSVPAETTRRLAATTAVQLLTVHSAKGLEFDEIYLPGLQFFHSPDQHVAVVPSAQGLQCDVGSERFAEAIAQEAEESLRERLRLQYVALTRAREHVFVHFQPAKLSTRENSLDWHFLQAAPAVNELEDFAEQLLRSDENTADWRRGLERICDHPAIRTAAWTVDAALPPSLPEQTSLGERGLLELGNWLQMPELRSPRRARSQLSFTSITRNPMESAVSAPIADQIAELPDLQRVAEDAPVDAEIVVLSAYKGPGFGQALHGLFELALRQGRMPDQAEIATGMEAAAMQPPLQTASEREALEMLIRRVLHGTLRPAEAFSAPSVCLAELAPSHCLVELGFHLPVDALVLTELAELGVGAGLGKLFFPEPEAGFAGVDGALVGFVDLIYQHAGRFYVLDYKSNYLGPRLEDYRGEALADAMHTHAYHLQHLIYTLALHRYLSASLPGYSYAKHFGGVHYLFVRAFGLTSAEDAHLGDYYYLAPETLVNALDQLFGRRHNSARPPERAITAE